jgi:hypothetical protein
MEKSRTPPWRKTNPRKGRSRKLSPEQREAARERARNAGRHYPNLVDNMWASQRSGGQLHARKKTSRKKTARKKTARKTAPKTARKKTRRTKTKSR